MGMAHLIRGRLELTAKALDDLTDDIDELCCLTASNLQRLRSARSELERARRSYRHPTYETEKAQLRSAEEVFSSYSRDLRGWVQEARGEGATVERLRQVKNEYADLLRLQQGIAAALTVGSDWQSPAFEYSGHLTAGRHSGSIREHLDDYKRDRHLQAREFEKSYLWEYVDIPPGLEMQALMTSCGMAAFTTILQFLCATVDREVSVVAIRGMYHECRRLLADSNLGSRVHWVDEANTSEIIDACRHLRPAALFLDSICNSKSVAVPDLQTVMLELAASARQDVCVIIDNTCASIFCQPLDLAVVNPCVRPLLFESLTKYAQYGLDRAAAGMIVAPKREATALASTSAPMSRTSVHRQFPNPIWRCSGAGCGASSETLSRLLNK